MLTFISKEDKNNLLLIFGGWSVPPRFYNDISVNDWDILLVSSYDDFSLPASLFSSYSSIGVVAWSMGVYAASRASLPLDKIAFAIAVNGTPLPVSDAYGIPTDIFRNTAKNLDARNLLKFRKRMAGNLFPLYSERLQGEDDIEDLRKQLNFIESHFLTEKSPNPTSPHFWTRAYISREDRIFPMENQINAWETFYPLTDIAVIEGPHLADLNHIVSSVIIPRERIARKFEKALPTYDANASAQQYIAERLASMAPEIFTDRILEIGQGTGFFSRLVARKLHPRTIDYIDLYPTPRLNLAPEENYYIEDAEKYIREKAKELRSHYDAVVSASALQWFMNPAGFFAGCANLLKPDGLLLCSTFSPSNLSALKPLNPYRLLYRSKEELSAILQNHFREVRIEEDSFSINFESKRSLLSHLGSTGVGASSKPKFSDSYARPSRSQAAAETDEFPTSLTYNPLFIRAQYPIGK